MHGIQLSEDSVPLEKYAGNWKLYEGGIRVGQQSERQKLQLRDCSRGCLLSIRSFVAIITLSYSVNWGGLTLVLTLVYLLFSTTNWFSDYWHTGQQAIFIILNLMAAMIKTISIEFPKNVESALHI